MACRTCSHTMQKVGSIEDSRERIFWCARCGSLKIERPAGGSYWGNDTEVPSLVGRCRQFGAAMFSESLKALWHKFGVDEAINVPEERKP